MDTPDLLCLKSNEPTIFIEVKEKKDDLKPLQGLRIDELNKLNCKSSLDNAQKVLEFALKNDEDSFSAKAYNIICLNSMQYHV